MRCAVGVCRSAVSVPGLRMVDASEGIIAMEWINGKSVRHLIPGGEDEECEEDDESEVESEVEVNPLQEYGLTQGKRTFVLGFSFTSMLCN